MRRLIINADDFGLTRGVNRAIVEACRGKVVTSATLMAGGTDFDDAVRLAQLEPRLAVGCHIVLLDGSPLLPASEVPSLIAKRSQSATFRRTWGSFATAALGGKLNPLEIEAEAIAQIRKLQEAGIAVTHVDTHKHSHIFPQVLRPLLRAAKACGVGAVRNPFGPERWDFGSRDFPLWKRWIGVRLLRVFRTSFHREVRKSQFATPDGILGLIATGRMTGHLLRRMLETMTEGTLELVCHPGYNDAQLRAMPTKLLESRQAELQILSSSETATMIASNGIQLISYRDLAGERATNHSTGA